MQSIIESAQDKCQVASRLRYELRRSSDRLKIKVAVDNVYASIRRKDIPKLIEMVEHLDRICKELRR